jgi:hypothetical protein
MRKTTGPARIVVLEVDPGKGEMTIFRIVRSDNPDDPVMAYFVILTSDANLVESFDEEPEALAALDQIVSQDPDHADEYAILRYDDDGKPFGDATPGSTARLHA